MNLLYREERLQILALVEDLKAFDLLDPTGGAISLRCGAGHVLTVAQGAGFRRWRLGEEDFVVLDPAGNAVQRGERLGPPGAYLHLQLYKLFPECKAVIHTHARYSTAFACLGLPVPQVTNLAETLGEVPCLRADDAAIKRKFAGGGATLEAPSGLPQRPELVAINEAYFAQIEEKLLPRREELNRHGLAFTLYRHGLFAFARTLDEAFNNLARIEGAARAFVDGRQIAGRLHE
jgi:ribulose-5-phosphate 4-epimerase/fuculose-1-phosphate aldolase